MRMHRKPWFLFLIFLLSFGSSPQSHAQDQEIWTNLGIYGGRVQDLAFDPSNPNRIFAATYLGRGLYLSEDGGSTWRSLAMAHLSEGEDTFDQQSVYAVAVAPSNPNIVWAAHNTWVAKSTDGGLSWTHIRNDTMQSSVDNQRWCLSIAIHPTNPDIVYVGTSGVRETEDVGGAIYRTEDGGTTWSKLNDGANLNYRVEDLAISPVNPEIVWAVTNSNGHKNIYDGSVYRSEDGGPFEEISFTFPPGTGRQTGGMTDVSVASKQGSPDTVVVGCGGGILLLEYDQEQGQWGASFPVGSSRLALAVAFSPSNPDVVYAAWMLPIDWGGDGLPKISRGEFSESGWNWQTLTTTGLVGNAGTIWSLAVAPDNEDRVLIGDQGLGVLVSSDGGEQWTPISEGLDAVIVYDVDADRQIDGRLLAASNAGLYERPDKDAAWIRRLNGDFRSASFHPASATHFFGGGERVVWRTTDGGLTWAHSNFLGYTYVEDIAVDPADVTRVYIATGHYGQQVMRSTDGGATFASVLGGHGYSFNTVVVDPHNSSHLLAGGGNFFSPIELGALWQSWDKGENWEKLTGLTNVIVNAVLIDPIDPDVIYAGCGYSNNDSPPLYKSSDRGVTWTVQADGMPGQSGLRSVTSLAAHRSDPEVLYAATFGAGVFVSPNQAGDWLNLGTPPERVFAIATGSLYAATGSGVYQLTGTGVVTGGVQCAETSAGIDNARVMTDLGNQCYSINGGSYMMVVPAGTFDLSACADNYATDTAQDVTVMGSDVTRWDFALAPGDGCTSGAGGSGSSSGGGGCFIGDLID